MCLVHQCGFLENPASDRKIHLTQMRYGNATMTMGLIITLTTLLSSCYLNKKLEWPAHVKFYHLDNILNRGKTILQEAGYNGIKGIYIMVCLKYK